ncbi:RNA polymerase sigma-70 factor [Rhodohalobacter sp. SW132]|uniref:RNA polymerase sigma-70 factor n=1 Tax=Rhodohalobacter sp. SW132 TaxID=2293433 RepID=UPI000E25F178|nr:RNA polymerase sigma-70 factor [Rhodohalobacter sp. SW132]REL39087.1 RNA polymerase sigma-70 factor [Rhodohalobacter sp. SW132]
MALEQKLNSIGGVGLSLGKDERAIRDNQWVEGVNKGERKAFEEIYRCYYPQLGPFLLRYVNSEKVAEDIIHNVFYKVWENRERLRADGTLKAYLFKAVQNQAFKYLAKNKGENTVELSDKTTQSDTDNNPEIILELKEFKEAYRYALKKLPEKRRNIFLMHREDHLTYREISEVLNISIKTVETQISRSMKFLIDQLSRFR